MELKKPERRHQWQKKTSSKNSEEKARIASDARKVFRIKKRVDTVKKIRTK